VHVTELRDGTFYAELKLLRAGEPTPSRPVPPTPSRWPRAWGRSRSSPARRSSTRPGWRSRTTTTAVRPRPVTTRRRSASSGPSSTRSRPRTSRSSSSGAPASRGASSCSGRRRACGRTADRAVVAGAACTPRRSLPGRRAPRCAYHARLRRFCRATHARSVHRTRGPLVLTQRGQSACSRASRAPRCCSALTGAPVARITGPRVKPEIVAIASTRVDGRRPRRA
jgi:hypothetical protein